MPVLGLADVEYAANIGMSDRASQPHFRGKPGEGLARTRSERSQQFQCNGLPQPEIVGAIDLTACSASEKTDDSEACREDATGHKSSIADPGRGRIDRVGEEVRIAREDLRGCRPRLTCG